MRARNVRPDEFDELVRKVAIIADDLEKNRVKVVDTVQFVNELQERLLIVAELPESAPFGALLRRNTGTIGERATLYLGNGAGQPLSRLVPTAL